MTFCGGYFKYFSNYKEYDKSLQKETIYLIT